MIHRSAQKSLRDTVKLPARKLIHVRQNDVCNVLIISVHFSIWNHWRFQFTSNDFLEQVFSLRHSRPRFDFKVQASFNLIVPIYTATEALPGVSVEETHDQLFPASVPKRTWKLQLRSYHSSAHFTGIVKVIGKRKKAHHKFEQHDTQRPDIHLRAVPLASHCLGRHVMWCAHCRESSACQRIEFLSDAEVNKFEIALSIEHDVLWLQIPKDDVSVVQGLQSK
mmetsp:Transcript_39139/g.103923  ORF Transcript_39139/g.103923 Transcript_39139/m.103923 type:complete len:223 (+) Transcript_39139:193-861(+)